MCAASPQESMSLHTTQEWHHHAREVMTQAQRSYQKATRLQSESRRAHEEVVSDNLSMYNELHHTLEQKVKTSYRLVEKLQQRADSVENSIVASKKSLADLQSSLLAKDAPLALCTWRMEQREKRPLREQVRDTVEVALEGEKFIIIEAQHKLKEAIKKTKTVLAALDSKLEELRQDIQQKNQAVSVDEMCLRSTQRSFHDVAQRTASTLSSPRNSSAQVTTKRSARHDVALHESNRNEVHRQQEAVKLGQSAMSREAVAKDLREECMKIIIRADRAVTEATSKSERALKERVNENQSVRRRLEAELKETSQSIDHTKNTIHETKSQLKALDEPMDLCSTCASWRRQRAAREHIQDPVTTTLYQHQMTLLKSQEELQFYHKKEKTALGDLQEKRDRLKDDLRDKTAALHIDLNCLAHEAALTNGRAGKVIAKDNLPIALKVDPGFVPSPGVSMKLPRTAR